MNKIIELKLKDNYNAWVKFSDGLEGEVNLKQFLGKGIASELLSLEKFKTAIIEPGGGISWYNGYDICPNHLRSFFN